MSALTSPEGRMTLSRFHELLIVWLCFHRWN
jgi:hypothetical protein